MQRYIVFGLVLFAFLNLQAQTLSGVEFYQNFKQTWLATDPLGYSDEKVKHLFYINSEVLNNEPLQGAHVQENLISIDDLFARHSLKHLFDETQKILPKSESVNENRKYDSAKKLTVILVSGLFAEFLENEMFSEVFDPNSAAAKSWNQVGDHLTDPVFNLQKVIYPDDHTQVQSEMPLKDLIRVSSLDNMRGEAVITYVLLRSPMMSLETIGDFKQTASIFTRRLNKYFSALNEMPENIAFVGYSRGAMISLEILAQAKRNNLGWLTGVKSMTSLGGVVFGSHLADEAFNLFDRKIPLASYNQMQALQELSDSLQFIDKSQDKTKIIFRNIESWIKFTHSLTQAQPELGPIDAKSKRSVDEIADLYKNADLSSYTAMMLKISREAGILPKTDSFWEIVKSIHSSFRKMSIYNSNIMKLKKIILGLTQSIRDLSTEARLGWWSHSELPTDRIVYYSFAGVFGNPSLENVVEGDLHRKQFALYQPGVPDYEASKNSYFTMKYSSRTDLNDTQVAAQRTRFWPNLIASLNQRNAGLRQVHLGFLGTHHWGLTLNEVIKSSSPALQNKFPRKAFLNAYSHTLLNSL